DDVAKIVYPLPVGDLFGVGRKMKASLESLGIRTIGHLAAADPEFLSRRFGKIGQTLSLYARGLDDSPVRNQRDPVKSVGNGVTYPYDLTDRGEIYSNLLALADSVAGRLRREGKVGSTVQLAVKDPLLTTLQRQTKLERPTHLAKEIAAVAMDLLERNWKIGSSPIRALTVTVTDLTEEGEIPLQYSLVASEQEQKSEKQEKVELAMDRLRGRYGKGIISFGSHTRPDPTDESSE
ncbi:MAG: DNA polymerase IV, partial [Clostridia bacterium]|nr:DNA polymerase IV [Clostridia bacterium]